MKEKPLIENLGAQGTSASQQYRELFVGKSSLGALLRYEVLMTLIGPLPGAAGYLLRRRFFPTLFAKVGAGTVFGRSLLLRSPGQITLGSKVLLDDHAVLDAKGQGAAIELGDQILIGRNTILSCTEATIRMGNFISIGPFCFFASKSSIEIGNNVSIGSGAHVMAGGHAFDDPDTPIIKQKRIHRGITIGDSAWIGSGSKILDGVTIGHDCIIGAGSVVGKDVGDYSVVLGNPARVVDNRKKGQA